jgi:hypothetical protein
MRESSGTGIGFTLLGVLAAALIGAVTGTIDDVIVWMFGLELIHTVLSWGAVILVITAIIFVSKRGDHDVAYGSTHTHFVAGGDKARESLQRHEDAHQKVCARVGGGGSTIHIWPENGGWSGKTVFHNPHRVAALPPEQKIAIALAGLIAAPDTTSPTDKPDAKAYAKESDNRSAAMRKGKSIARRIV